MIKLAANLSMLFPDAPFLDRFGRAAASGFKGVEYIGPYDHAEDDVIRALKDGGLEQVLFNMPPGYFLNYQAQGIAILDAVQRPNIALQMDFYHAQVMEGDLTRKYRANQARIGHLQIAGMPDRHEPDEGELAYDWLLGTIAASGYKGWIGCEYRPKERTEDGLGWAEEWLK